MSASNSQPGDASEVDSSQPGFSDIELRSQLLQAVLNLSGDATFIVDDKNQIRFWNPAAEAFYGIGPSKLAADTIVKKSVIFYHESADCLVGIDRTVDQIQVGDRTWRRVVLKSAKSLEECPPDELYRLAQTDHLSNLLNRRGFQKALESNLHHQLTLAIVDIDNLKAINDSHGHEAGDNAIRFVADALTAFYADAISIGRLGGDEFGLVLRTTDLGSTQKSFLAVCELVHSSSKSTYAFPVSISIGVAVSQRPKTLPRDLLTTADKAMYQSKHDGRNRVTVVPI